MAAQADKYTVKLIGFFYSQSIKKDQFGYSIMKLGENVGGLIEGGGRGVLVHFRNIE